MTNTGDFRRYSYSTDAAYALKAFDVNRSSVAPAYSPNRKKDFKIRENNGKKSRAQLLQEQRLGFAQIVKIMVTAVLSIAMLFGVIYTHVQKNELMHEISNLESQLNVAKSENVRITSELDALVSMSMIDKYAVEELGMTKMRSNQIMYIDVSQYKEERFSAAQLLNEKTQKQNNDKTISSNK